MSTTNSVITAAGFIGNLTGNVTGNVTGAVTSTGNPDLTSGFALLSNAAVAAAGSGQSTYTALAKTVNAVTGADGTVGVALPAAAAGKAVFVINTVSNQNLPVAPVNGGDDQINSLTAGTGVFTMGPGCCGWFIPISATQWYVSGDAAILSQGAEIDAVCDVSARRVLAGSTLAVTAASHAGKLIVFDQTAGSVCTLPAATGSGNFYEFTTGVLATSNSHIVKVANANDFFAGNLQVTDNADGTVTNFGTTGNGTTTQSDTITLNRTTTGSVKIAGDYIRITDVAANNWNVRGSVVATGSEATPFSATV